jgi:glutaminyl-peptide cyclotransferase
VWQTQCIARIDPQSAAVTGWILMHGLRDQMLVVNQQQGLPADVLNGIAYDADTKRLFVTGKLWAQLYEIRVVAYPEVDQKKQLEYARTTCNPPV